MKVKIAAALILAGVTAWLWLNHLKPSQRKSGMPVTVTKVSSTDSSAVLPTSETAFWLNDAATGLRQNSDPAKSRRMLEELRLRIATKTKIEAVTLLRAALDAGLDAPTHLDLKPRGDGTLADASSWRVFLLDQLLALDAAAAREVAKKILDQFTSPDEWAISLAACATDTSAAGREFVQRKAREMVLHEAWQLEPSAGFLEAFDVFVFMHDTEFVPELATFLAQTNNRAVAHAAFLTLDRLAQNDTAATLNALAAKPELLQGREATRAGYFARADVRDGEQRAVVERYLMNAALTPGELERFAGTFPNANFMVSQNLLTRSTTPDGVEISARDAAAFDTVNQWLADPRFAHLKPQIAVLRARLEQFVKAR